MIKIILIVSFCAISALFYLIYGDFRTQQDIGGQWTTYLPILNCVLNSLSAVCVAAGLYFIKLKSNKTKHALCMRTAFVFSALFLVSYCVYHYFQGDTKYLGQGWLRYFYFFILITHIILSCVVLPMILSVFYFAISKQWKKHKKLAKLTYPVWLYVSITGVLIYVILHHT